MSHYTAHQARCYWQVFERYAEGHPRRLSLSALQELMPLFGPELTKEQAKALIYKYDSACEGLLIFDDFLELLADYEVTLKHGRDIAFAAFEHLARKAGAVDGISKSQFAHALEVGSGLDQDDIDAIADEFFPANGELMTSADFFVRLEDTPLAWRRPIDPSEVGPTNGRLVIGVCAVTNLEQLGRPKARRGRGALEYATLDPLVAVRLAGISKETAAIVGTLSPEWNQPVTFPIHYPSLADLAPVEALIAKERIEFHLFDHVTMGTSPHLQWLGCGSIPLATALSATGSPMSILLEITSPTPLPNGNPVLEVSVSLKAESEGALPDYSIIDHLRCPEELWNSTDNDKLETDIGQSFTVVQAEASRLDGDRDRPSMQPQIILDSASGFNGKVEWLPGWSQLTLERIRGVLHKSQSSVWQHMVEFLGDYRASFARRSIRLIGLDEHGAFRPLPCFLRPLSSPLFKGIETLDGLAANVARISTAASDITASGDNLPPFLWLDTDHTASPATVLARHWGSPLEHALLLCSLFMGRGITAFVAFGHGATGQTQVWVVTLLYSGRRPGASLRSRSALVDKATPASVAETAESFAPERFVHRGLRAEEERRRTGGKGEPTVLFWEATTGRSFIPGEHPAFERIGCLVNERNILVNVQQSDQTARTAWDTSRPELWHPVLTDEILDAVGPPVPCYSVPSAILLDARSESLESQKTLLEGLVAAIQGYRRHYLYIPATPMHRHVSKLLSDFLDDLEASRPVDATPRVIDSLPDHCLWHGVPFQFKTKDVGRILQQLAFSGILDCSVPDTSYAIAVKVFPYPWGLSSVWVYVGYLCDLNKTL